MKRVVVCALALAVGSTPTGQADVPPVSFSVTTSTRAFSYPDRLSANVTVRITTGATAQNLSFFPSSAPWPDRMIVGRPITFGRPELSGPGSIGPFQVVEAQWLWPVCFRGAEPGGLTSFGVSVPADVTTTLVVPVVAFGPAWPDTSYTPTLSVSTGAGEARQPLEVPPMAMRGKAGVHIHMRIASSKRGHVSRAGRPVAIFGSTDPRVAHARINVTAQSGQPGALRPGTIHIGEVRTDARGRFRIRRWVPPLSGVYQLTATYPHPEHGFAADSNCGFRFSVAPL
jgi:hypothetical protein